MQFPFYYLWHGAICDSKVLIEKKNYEYASERSEQENRSHFHILNCYFLQYSVGTVACLFVAVIPIAAPWKLYRDVIHVMCR